MGRRAAIYCRISKDTEGKSLGVDRQERECRQLCQKHKLDVIATFIDNDISAFSGRARPGFAEAQEVMKAGDIDVLVAWHPDRLTRQTRELEDLIDLLEGTGVDVLTVTSGEYDLHTPSGRMGARIVGSVARYESEHKSERLLSKSSELALSGAPAGGRPPYGYQWQHPDNQRGKGNLVVNHDEARTLRWIAKQVLAGCSTLTIERALNAKGIPTREGRPWHHSTVRAVIVNPAVAALRIHRREIAGSGTWKPIFERAEWEVLVATIADPARKRTRPAMKYVLSGLVRSTAGDPMNGKPERGGRSYSTSQRRAPSGEWVNPECSTSVDAEKLEEYVVESALIALRDWKPTPAKPETDLEVAEIEAELVELSRLRGERTISMAEWLAQREPLTALLEAAQSKVRRDVSKPRRLLDAPDIRKAWKTATVDERRRAIGVVIEAVIVDKASRGRWTTMPERVTIKWRA